MSDYVRMKVLRVPTKKYGIKSSYDLEEEPKFEKLFYNYSAGRTTNCFAPAPTETSFLDYILEYDNDASAGDYGRTRALSEREKAKYYPAFREIIPDISMNDVRLVEFCWYDCTEAPDYYDDTDDPFYMEV